MCISRSLLIAVAIASSLVGCSSTDAAGTEPLPALLLCLLPFGCAPRAGALPSTIVAVAAPVALPTPAVAAGPVAIADGEAPKSPAPACGEPFFSQSSSRRACSSHPARDEGAAARDLAAGSET